MDRAKRGDEEAFDALARLVGDQCMAIAAWILRDADLAEDAVQAALVRAWRELRTLRDPQRFEAWLHRILTNECYAEARRRTRWSGDIRLLLVDGPAASFSRFSFWVRCSERRLRPTSRTCQRPSASLAISGSVVAVSAASSSAFAISSRIAWATVYDLQSSLVSTTD